MKRDNHFISLSYSFLRKYKVAVFIVFAALFAICAYSASQMKVTQDIEIMLPDNGEKLAKHYKLLQESPLTKKVIITISNNDGKLDESIDKLSENLAEVSVNGRQIFKNVTKGPPPDAKLQMFSEITSLLPNILTDEDFTYLESFCENGTIDTIMSHNLSQLSSPAWLGYKKIIENDPLGLYVLFFKKIKSAARLMDISVDGERFKSSDGMYGLIMAEQSDEQGSFTNIENAVEIIAGYKDATANLPSGSETFMVSPANYTLANANAIKGDLRLVIPLAFAMLTLLFVVMLRRAQALVLLLVPTFAAIISAAAVSVLYGDISGIVIGFSSVLLGITVDYAIHTYLSVRHSVSCGYGVSHGLCSVSKPVLFSALTSITAFAALFSSNIEGIRQFAMFGIAGITAGVFTSLVFIPLIFKDGITRDSTQQAGDKKPNIIFPRAAILFLIFTCLTILCGRNIKIDANFKNLGYVSDEIKSNEEKFAAIWGKMRDFAVFFAVGDTEDEARATNEKTAAYLNKHFTPEDIVTVSDILPSNETQHKNIERWQSFWQENQLNIFARLETAATKYGFADNSFDAFINTISHSQPKQFGLETIESKGFKGISDFFTANGGKTYITLLYGKTDAQMQDDLAQIDGGITVASFAEFNTELAEIIKEDILMFCSIALCSILFILLLLFRNIAKTTTALIPVAAGIAGVFAVFGLSETVMGLFHIVSLPLVIGLAADYGIFMTSAGKDERAVAMRGVLLSGLTTAIGFGVLALASHPAMNAIGVTVLTGITAAAASALILIPYTMKR